MKYFIQILCVSLLLLSSVVTASAQTDDKSVDRLKRVKEISETQKQIEGNATSKWMQSSENEASDLSASRVLQALGLCLGVFFIFVAVMKRWNKGAFTQEQKHIEILEKVALNQKTALVRVRYNQKELLLAVGGEQAKLLTSSVFPAEQNNSSLFEEELNKNTHINGFKDEVPCDIDVTLSA